MNEIDVIGLFLFLTSLCSLIPNSFQLFSFLKVVLAYVVEDFEVIWYDNDYGKRRCQNSY